MKRSTKTANPPKLTFTITRVAGSPDREALVAFYNATGGPNWNYNNWLSHCQPIGQWDGVTTDISDDRVTALELEGGRSEWDPCRP